MLLDKKRTATEHDPWNRNVWRRVSVGDHVSGSGFMSRDNRACGRPPSARQTGRTRQAPRMSDPRFCTPGKARRSATRHLELKSNPSATVNFGIARRPHLKRCVQVCRGWWLVHDPKSCVAQSPGQNTSGNAYAKEEIRALYDCWLRCQGGTYHGTLVDTDEVHSSPMSL